MLTRFKMGVHFSVVVVLILLLQHSQSHGSSGTSTNKKEGKVLNIGVILDSGSFVSKDAQIAMEIAREDFNAKSRGYKLKLHYNNSGGKPLQALSSGQSPLPSFTIQSPIKLMLIIVSGGLNHGSKTNGPFTYVLSLFFFFGWGGGSSPI